MSDHEHPGEAMFRLHEANRALAHALGTAARRLFARNPAPALTDNLLSSPSFYQQEPDLAKESHIPGTYA